MVRKTNPPRIKRPKRKGIEEEIYPQKFLGLEYDRKQKLKDKFKK